MKTRQVTVREGEYLGPVDWNYNFRGDFGCHTTPDKDCTEAVERLRQLCSGGEWRATTDGGGPRIGWGKVLQVGMYDGWPYWRPVPSVLITGPLGPEWHSFRSISGIEKLSSDQGGPQP